MLPVIQRKMCIFHHMFGPPGLEILEFLSGTRKKTIVDQNLEVCPIYGLER